MFPITIYDIPKIIKKNSNILKKARIDIKIKELDIKFQKYDYFPNLFLNYSGSLNNLFKNDSSHTHNIKLNSSWNVFNNLNTWLNHRIENFEYSNLIINYKKKENTEIFNNLMLYITAIKNKFSYELVMSNEIISKTQYDYVLSRKKQGIASEIDLISAKSEYDNSLYNTKYYKILYTKSILDLEKSLHLTNIIISYFKITNIKTILSSKLFNKYKKYYLKSFEKKNIDNDFNILQTQKKINNKDLWIKTASINTSFSWYGFNYTSTTDYSTNKFLDYYIGINISIPIFNKFQNVNQHKKILFQIMKNDIDEKELIDTKLNNLRNLINNYNDKIELLNVSKSRLSSSKTTYLNIKESYTLGITSLLNLYLTEQKYKNAEKDFLLLKYDIIKLKINLAYFFNQPDKWEQIF